MGLDISVIGAKDGRIMGNFIMIVCMEKGPKLQNKGKYTMAHTYTTDYKVKDLSIMLMALFGKQNGSMVR